jgi:hypothetical protein
MKRPFWMAVPILLFALSARAQNTGLPQDKGTIAGTVIDAVSEQVLKGAEVRLRAILNASTPGSQPASQPNPQPAESVL